MRQRRAGAAATMDTDVVQQQEEQTLLLQRQQERQSQLRQREAREAEKGLASLVGLFGKMSVRDWHGTISYLGRTSFAVVSRMRPTHKNSFIFLFS
jgi:hypothetical protein